MIRDKLKNKDYFLGRYEKDDKRLIKSMSICDEILETQGENAPGKRICYYDNYIKALQTFYSGYSLGLTYDKLKEYVDIIIENILLSWDGTVYDDIEIAIILAILFEYSDDESNKIIDVIIKYKYEDKLLYLLLNYLNPKFKQTTDNLKFKKATSLLIEIIEISNRDKDLATVKIKSYLDKQWFNMQKQGVITNKDHLKENRYRGYWCIECAALVKVLQLNDTILKESVYYPYDLAHMKE